MCEGKEVQRLTLSIVWLRKDPYHHTILLVDSDRVSRLIFSGILRFCLCFQGCFVGHDIMLQLYTSTRRQQYDTDAASLLRPCPFLTQLAAFRLTISHESTWPLACLAS